VTDLTLGENILDPIVEVGVDLLALDAWKGYD